MSNYDNYFKSVKVGKGNQKAQPKQSTRQEGQKPKRKPARPPIMSILFLIIGLVGCVAGLQYQDQVLNWVEQVEVMMLSEASAEAKAEEKPAETKAEGAEVLTDPTKTAETKDCVVQKGFTEEEMSHFNKLNERKKELDLRDAELAALEEELHKQKLEVESRLSNLERIRTDIASGLKEKVEIDQQKVATLVDFYANMKPKQAADIFGTLNEDLAIEVLSRMKKKNAADILNLLEPTKARALSEKFTGYKRR